MHEWLWVRIQNKRAIYLNKRAIYLNLCKCLYYTHSYVWCITNVLCEYKRTGGNDLIYFMLFYVMFPVLRLVVPPPATNFPNGRGKRHSHRRISFFFMYITFRWPDSECIKRCGVLMINELDTVPESLFVVVLCRNNIYGHQDWYLLVTGHTHGDFILVLHHWEIMPSVPWPDISLCHIILTLNQPVIVLS